MPPADERRNLSNLEGGSVAEIVSRTILDVEREKTELKEKSCNIIVSGLSSVHNVSDRELLEKFCEDNLTVKTKVFSTRRLGNRDNPGSKLCATLDSSDSVKHLLDSSALLRRSNNPTTKRVFFNPDLTRNQEIAAYKARCLKRERRQAPQE